MKARPSSPLPQVLRTAVWLLVFVLAAGMLPAQAAGERLQALDDALIREAATPQKVTAAPRTALPADERVRYGIRPPAHLYHWTTVKSLERWAAGMQPGDPLPLKAIKPDFLVVRGFRQLANLPGLYAWVNPAAGLGCFGTEIYGWGQAVLQLAIAPKARAVRIITVERDEIPLDIDLSRVDLILHQLIDRQGKLLLQEWIILDAKVITAYTGDPDHLRPALEKEIAHLQDRAYRYPAAQKHCLMPGNLLSQSRGYIIKVLRAYLDEGYRQVPDLFRKAR
ncbi:MAG: hypothetical protein GX442_13970 [Candidatus Riflebacteria bacterium]|nr:hypothetical protein [Candidatus Riflebacteria bacterium]